jgi:arylsulfatase A-like enzyme
MMKERINKKFYFMLISLLLLIFISGCVKEGGTSSKAEYKCPNCNVILITIDALRPDHLGCYGYERNTSPNIDRLAKEGILFKNAIAQYQQTTQSIASILTGNYPHTHGVITLDGILPNSSITLAEVLKDNDYETGAVVSIDTLATFTNLNQGFDFYDDEIKMTGVLIEKREADKVTDSAINWVKKNMDRSFFLWVHYIDTHGPYRPPYPYNETFIGDKYFDWNKSIPLNLDSSKPFGSYGLIPYYVIDRNITNPDYYISQYDGEIRFVDNEIKRLLLSLEDLGLAQNTIIIITADHGEYLGERNVFFNHGGCPYDIMIKVPLVIRVPKTTLKNKIIDAQVRSIDIMPTILDILDIPLNNKIDGASLESLISGKGNFSHYAIGAWKNEFENFMSIRTNEWKFIYDFNNQTEKLYNLKEDPKETKNVVNEEPEIAENLKLKLSRWMSKAWEKLSEPEKAEISEEMKEKLKALGYLT